jgi:hypothetical protein
MRIYALLEQPLALRQTALRFQQLLVEALPHRDLKLRPRARYLPVPGGSIIKAYMIWVESQAPHVDEGYVPGIYVAEYTSGEIDVKDGHCMLACRQFDNEAKFIDYVIKDCELARPVKRDGK